MSDQPNQTFKRVIVLRNPVSTNAVQAKQRIAELRDVFGAKNVQVMETVKGGHEANRTLLYKLSDKLGPWTLLCIAAGDGTVNMVIETLVQDERLSDDIRRTPILPLWGGNANDLAHMLNGNAYRSRVREAAQHGAIVRIRPLACTLTQPDGKTTIRIAACYASFGATAFAAARLTKAEERKNPIRRIPGGRYVADFVAGFLALRRAPTFRVQEAGTERLVYERTFANGSRFAKVERLPLKLDDEVFLQHTLEDQRVLTVLPRLWEAVQKRFASKFKHDFAEFTVGQTILAQFDGEPMQIAAGTTVCVTLADQPFYALSTLLGKQKST